MPKRRCTDFAERKIRNLSTAVPENPFSIGQYSNPIEESPGVLKPAETLILKIKTHAELILPSLKRKVSSNQPAFKAHLAPSQGTGIRL